MAVLQNSDHIQTTHIGSLPRPHDLPGSRSVRPRSYSFPAVGIVKDPGYPATGFSTALRSKAGFWAGSTAPVCELPDFVRSKESTKR
jgi:hypothetical protein